MTNQITRASSNSRSLIDRILDLPDVEKVVRSLEPRLLHQFIRRCGLEDSGEIISLATAEQLSRILEEDLWAPGKAGTEDQLDAERFGQWLEVLAETDAAGAAQKIAAMDLDFVTAAFSQQMLVMDGGELLFQEDGENAPVEARARLTAEVAAGDLGHDFGRYIAISKRSESWEALLAILRRILKLPG